MILGVISTAFILLFGIGIPYFTAASSGTIDLVMINKINQDYAVDIYLNEQLITSFYYNHSDAVHIKFTDLPFDYYNVRVSKFTPDRILQRGASTSGRGLSTYHSYQCVCNTAYDTQDIPNGPGHDLGGSGSCHGHFVEQFIYYQKLTHDTEYNVRYMEFKYPF